MTAPKIAYWTSRDPLPPPIAPTPAKSRAANSAAPYGSGNRPTTVGVSRLQCPRRIDLVAGCKPLNKTHSAQTGKNYHIRQQQPGGNGDTGRLDMPVGLLIGDNNKRANEVDRQQRGEGEREARPRIPRTVSIPSPLPEAVHARD
jgi:hypothetical protein